MREITVAILTPYLTDNLQSLVDRSPSKKWLAYQVGKAGYNPNNLSELESIRTSRNIVRLLKTQANEDNATLRATLHNLIEQARNGFSISGSTESFEDLIRSHKGTGALVARYSIFYGRESGYTGRSAAESGYSFDIPKNPEIVKAMLTHDDLLEAIQERNMSSLKKALKAFNCSIPTPVLATSYLPHALELN